MDFEGAMLSEGTDKTNDRTTEKSFDNAKGKMSFGNIQSLVLCLPFMLVFISFCSNLTSIHFFLLSFDYSTIVESVCLLC